MPDYRTRSSGMKIPGHASATASKTAALAMVLYTRTSEISLRQDKIGPFATGK
jgi:hypothetical protein